MSVSLLLTPYLAGIKYKIQDFLKIYINLTERSNSEITKKYS